METDSSTELKLSSRPESDLDSEEDSDVVRLETAMQSCLENLAPRPISSGSSDGESGHTTEEESSESGELEHGMSSVG